jgi:hypothetical protein
VRGHPPSGVVGWSPAARLLRDGGAGDGGAPARSAAGVEESAEHPCALLTEDQLLELGLAEGSFTEARPQQRVPQGCDRQAGDPSMSDHSLALVISSIAEYRGIDTPPAEEFELGGRTWGRYDGVFGEGDCDIMLSLGPQSFVSLLSINLTDKAKVCDLPKAAAPLVTANLQ